LISWHERWPTSFDLALDRQRELHAKLQRLCRRLATDTRAFGGRMSIIVAEWWLSKSEAQRTCLQLVAAQAVVFGLWQLAPLQAFMKRNFLSDPLSGRMYTNLVRSRSLMLDA
jgi:hypothetical protein